MQEQKLNNKQKADETTSSQPIAKPHVSSRHSPNEKSAEWYLRSADRLRTVSIILIVLQVIVLLYRLFKH